ncbi:MAG: hypothetical protein WC867_02145 [Candidatus Pacearchaeota archaeon]|jgi:hypothetical protein
MINYRFLIGIMIFLMGFISANLLNLMAVYGYENPKDLIKINFSDEDPKTPHDIVKDGQIEVYNDKVIINIEDATLSKYAPTGSMIPILNENSNGIRIKPKSEEDIQIGDIITYEKDNILIVHRVIDKGNDSQGNYFLVKGDNNSIADGKVRYKEIKYITIGVIW